VNGMPGRARIDRRAVVTRHHVVLHEVDPESPLSLGNGEFAFTADATGLQTFPELFEKTIPLGTQSQWGWHTFPNPEGWSIDRFQFAEFDSHGRKIGFADIPGNRRTPEINWLRANPHRLHLGRIGLLVDRDDGRRIQPKDMEGIEQTLELWDGRLVSRFRIDGHPVEVRTVVHPDRDAVAVRIESPLVGQGRLGIAIHFPYGTGEASAADWTRPDRHRTVAVAVGSRMATLARHLDQDRYCVRLRWSSGAALEEIERHRWVVRGAARGSLPGGAGAPKPPQAPAENPVLELAVEFAADPGLDSEASRESPAATANRSRDPADAVDKDRSPSSRRRLTQESQWKAEPIGFPEAESAAREHWNRFWSSGGAIDLSGSKDHRALELERRIVLSQYLTAIQCAGRYPPQETGLAFNSWEGKFHLEMHWWHAAHFALWDRLELLERSLPYYASILPRARGMAARQGYAGARWPKMTDPRGAESPSGVGPFLIWQQPHPIYYAELCYRARKERGTLERYREVVEATAEFMASFAVWDGATERFVLGPPLQCAQEVFPRSTTMNPAFELTYWRWGLETAQAWRQRLGLPRQPRWDRVLEGLARPAVSEGKYLFAESAPQCYTERSWARDHPSVTAALGMLPGPGIDREIMGRTLGWIWEHWDWPSTWGWDYPMLAMCAARLGQPERAVDALLLDTPKNVYRSNGHNHQRPGLTIYLPGNGGLLAAAAMMAAGWDGAPALPSPGFPNNGQWNVRWEALRPMP